MEHRTAMIGAVGITAFCVVLLGSVVAGATMAPRPSSGQAAPGAVTITADQAAVAARVANPGAQQTRQPELVSFRGMLAYEVMLDRGPAYVNASTGWLLYNPPAPQTAESPTGVQIGNQPAAQNGNAAQPTQQISRDQAVQIASAAMNGARPSGAELRTMQGYTLYDVTFANGAELYIDAQTGGILASNAQSLAPQTSSQQYGSRESNKGTKHDHHDEEDDDDD